MSSRMVVFLLLLAAVGTSSPAAAHASEAPMARIPEMVSRAHELGGRVVTFEGEAIGEALRADSDTVWVNVLDEGTAIGVWMPKEMASQITRYGVYRQTGDIVRVTGILNLACDRHGGDLDVHATALTVVEPGKPRSERVRPLEALLGAVGLATAGAAVFLSRVRER